MSEEIKKQPHHLSAEGRALKAQQQALEGKGIAPEFDEVALQEKLKAVQSISGDTVAQPDQKSQETNNQNQSESLSTQPAAEAMLPLSVVQAMIDNALKGRVEIPQQQAPIQTIQYIKDEYDIEDIPECQNWESKDREYEYIGAKPISASIPAKHTDLIPLQYHNKIKNSVHILRWATNQPSFFVEKQSKEPGSVAFSEIIFNYGRLKVPAREVNLQKFLHIHPYKGVIFREYDAKEKSREVVNAKKLRNQASGLVFEVSEVVNRAIAGLVLPNYIESWEPEMLEEEILAYAENNPEKYIKFTEDPTIKTKGIIRSSLHSGELIYENYRFLNKHREPIIEVPKNEDEMDAMVKYLQSGVGRTMLDYLQNV